MVNIKHTRHKPIYKKFVSLRKNVQNRQKVYTFKKQKWQFLLSLIARQNKTRKKSFNFFDQFSNNVSKFNTYFSKNYKKKVTTKKVFLLFYGNLSEKLLKKMTTVSKIKSDQVSNKLNSATFFNKFFEQRLDVVLLRSHFVLSIRNSRQLIAHGNVFVNGERVKNSSFVLKKGDCIQFSKKVYPLLQTYIVKSTLWPLPASYLQISYKSFQISLVNSIILANTSDKFSLWLNTNEVMGIFKK
jgi:ribosomal protein S4